MESLEMEENLLPHKMGEFEALVEDVTSTLRHADGWYRVINSSRIVIDTIISDRPELANNGGHYDHFRKYQCDGIFGVRAWNEWSCDCADMQNKDDFIFECVLGDGGLERIARLAALTIAAESWLKKEPGCMQRLKEAVKALSD
jgi:hypothetical protein